MPIKPKLPIGTWISFDKVLKEGLKVDWYTVRVKIPGIPEYQQIKYAANLREPGRECKISFLENESIYIETFKDTK